MAITNVISNTSNIFKDIIVRNYTNKNLNDLHFSYLGSTRPVIKISDLPKGQQIKKSLLVSHLINPTKLLLVSENGEDKKEIIAFDNLSSLDLSPLVLTIKELDNELTITAS